MDWKFLFYWFLVLVYDWLDVGFYLVSGWCKVLEYEFFVLVVVGRVIVCVCVECLVRLVVYLVVVVLVWLVGCGW